MEAQLYLRIRGRVLGPYDQDKLQFLARRGQLSRMHELSPDGVSWSPASNFPELFVVDVAEVVVGDGEHDGSQSNQQAESYGVAEAAGPPTMASPSSLSGLWYYNKDGRQCGPVDGTFLQQMLLTGQIQPEDLVWSEGMPAWVPARQVPGLTPFESRPNAGKETGHKSLPLDVCKAAMASRGWVIFLAITAFIYAGLSLFGGLLLVIQGANSHLAPVIAAGLFGLIDAAVAAVGGILLMTYAARLGSLVHLKQPVVLEKALDSLRAIWIFTSIVLIVFLTLVTVMIVWAIAIGAGIPTFRF